MSEYNPTALTDDNLMTPEYANSIPLLNDLTNGWYHGHVTVRMDLMGRCLWYRFFDGESSYVELHVTDKAMFECSSPLGRSGMATHLLSLAHKWRKLKDAPKED